MSRVVAESLEKLIVEHSTREKFRTYSARYALGIAVFAAMLLGYIKTQFIFQRFGTAEFLVDLDFVALSAALVLGLLGLPKLESFLALFIFTVTAIYYFDSGPLYGIP